METVNIITKGEVRARAAAARAEFERVCVLAYGYVPFSDEYFRRTWPQDRPDRTSDALSEVRTGAVDHA